MALQWKSNALIHSDIILELSVGFNPFLRTGFKRNWSNKGMIALGHIIDSPGGTMEMEWKILGLHSRSIKLLWCGAVILRIN